MWKCPICNNEEKSEYICQKCGYDVRKDFVRSRTVQPVPLKDSEEYIKRISEFDEKERQKAMEAARTLLEAIKKEKEKQAEAERKAEAARKAEEARKVEAARKAEEARKAEAERKANEEKLRREEEAKDLYKELLNKANIDEKTLDNSERAHLLGCCRGGRSMAEGYIAHLKNTRFINEQQKKTDNQKTYKNTRKPTYEKKKTPKVFRLVAGVMLVGIGAATVLSVMEGSSDEGNSGYSSDAVMTWDAIEANSIWALSDGSIDYEAISLEGLCEELSMQNYYVSWPGEVSENMVEGTMESRRMWAQLNNGGSAEYNIRCDDWYGAGATEWHEREFYFNDSRYRSDFVEDETLSLVYESFVPLPYDIQFGDTFDEVYGKLGLTQESIEYGTDIYKDDDLYVSIEYPEIQNGEYIQSGYLFISCGNYTFSYSFDDYDNELYSYYVSIYH